MTLRSLHADLHRDELNIDILTDREHADTLTLCLQTPAEDYIELTLTDNQARQLLARLEEAFTTYRIE